MTSIQRPPAVNSPQPLPTGEPIDPGPRRRAQRENRRRGSIAQLASASYLTIAFALITGPLVARALGPSVRGEYAAVFVYSTMLATVLGLGISPAILHRLVNRIETPERLMGSALRFSTLLLVPALTVSVAIVMLLLDVLSGVDIYLAIGAIALAPVAVLGTCFQAFLTASGALGPMSFLRVLPLAVNFIGVVALALVGRLTLSSYLILTISIALLTAAATWHLVRVRPNGYSPLGPLLRFGLKSYPGTFAGMLNVQLDQIILVPLVAPEQLAYYAIAVTISRVPSRMAEAIGARATGSVVDPGTGLVASRVHRYLRLTLLVSTSGCIALAATSPVLIPLVYGSAFGGVVAPLLLLLPATIANSGSWVAAPSLVAGGRPGVTSTAELTSLVITGIGLWFALPRYGIVGAAAVSSLAYSYRFAVQAFVLLRGHGIRSLIPRWADCLDVFRALRHAVRI